MVKTTKFRVQAGALVCEWEGSEAFVKSMAAQHRDNIGMILDEQVKIIKKGAAAPTGKRRGRPPGKSSTKKVGRPGRRPGRQPVIIRDSKLALKPRKLDQLKKYLASVAQGGRLSKDGSVFAIAYNLCTNVFNKDVFTAGDVTAAYKQIGKIDAAPPVASVDVVQMLRNLAASSIGKEWVQRNPDGTFSLTAKGKAIGASGKIVRPRGRKADTKKAVKKAVKAKRGRPPKAAKAKRGRPPKAAKKKVGRPPKAAKKKVGRPPKAVKAKRGRPPKAAKKKVGRPPKAVKAKRGRPPKVVKAKRGRPPKAAKTAELKEATPKRRVGRPRKNAAE